MIRFLYDEKMPEIAEYKKDLCLPKLIYDKEKGKLYCQDVEKENIEEENIESEEESDSSFDLSGMKQKSLLFRPDAHSTRIERTHKYNTRSNKQYSYVDVYTDSEEGP